MSLLPGLRQTPVSMSPSLRGPYTPTEQFLLFLNVLVFLIGTIGNGLLIRTFYVNRDEPGSRFVLILAIVDLITSVWIPVMAIGQIMHKVSHHTLWPFGKVGCYILKPFYFSLFIMSVWLLLAICLERVRLVRILSVNKVCCYWY